MFVLKQDVSPEELQKAEDNADFMDKTEKEKEEAEANARKQKEEAARKERERQRKDQEDRIAKLAKESENNN